MLTEHKQAKEDSNQLKMVVQHPALPSLTLHLSQPQHLFKWLPKRHAGVINYPLGMPNTLDTYLTISHGNHPFPFTATAYPLTDAKKTPQPFLLDYMQTLLSLLNILSVFYTKLLRQLLFLDTLHGGRFSNWPTERYEGTIYVLMNNSGWVFLEFGTCFATFIYLVLIL
jgi:hypothetical protein